jgi:hypothetical protein
MEPTNKHEMPQAFLALTEAQKVEKLNLLLEKLKKANADLDKYIKNAIK